MRRSFPRRVPGPRPCDGGDGLGADETRPPWRRSRQLILAAIALSLLSLRPGARDATDPDERVPSSELILLFSGEVRGNLEPCG